MDRHAPCPPLRALTTAMARGDDGAWTEFHRDHGPVLFRQLLAATRGDHALASEALQQAYLRIARHVRACDSEAMFAGWLRTVARTALSDCRRRQRSFWQLLLRRAAEPSEMSEPETAAQSQQIEAALERALASLPAADRDLLEKKYVSGRDLRSLAASLAVSEKAVESRLTRARGQLRRELTALLSRHE